MLRILAIGGMDPCGGAGLAADLRMVHARGAMPLVLITALTVQNRHGMQAVHPVERRTLEQCLDAIFADGPVHGIKTGLFASGEQIRWIAGRLSSRQKGVPLVVDPVLSATAGGWSPDPELVDAYRERLLPMATVVTPNLPELERILPGDDGAGLQKMGCAAVLVKGGHGEGEMVRDVLYTDRGRREFAHPRLPVGPVHGTGCALASALAVHLCSEETLEAACAAAISDLQRCLLATPSSPDGLPQPLKIL